MRSALHTHDSCHAISRKQQKAAFSQRQTQPRSCRLRAVTPCMAVTGGTIVREVLTPSQRQKLDPNDDRQWYAFPRIVYHVDDQFLAQLTELYRQRILKDAVVLDLMSSWVSHLPPEKQYSRVVGHGLNAAELAKNKQLTDFFVRDLNKNPRDWAFPDQTFDAVICCVSVQYLQQPEEVFAEIYRVLKPCGVVIFSFSNRQFYEKAVSAWRANTGFGRVQLVKSYFGAVAGFTEPEVVTEVPVGPGGGPSRGPFGQIGANVQSFFKRSASDPFYAVIAYRNLKPVHDE